jgi:ribosome recycling factor
MKSLKLKTTCTGNHVHTTLANPRANLGDSRHSSVQIRQINNIPADVSHLLIIKKWDETCDMTKMFTGIQRLEFDFAEIGDGRILKA